MSHIASNHQKNQDLISKTKITLNTVDKYSNSNIDNKTTISGNKQIHSLSTNQKNIINNFSKFLERDLNNILNISHNFKKLDETIGKDILK
ncbi:MAG: TIGR04197 family type VII secretion effector [Oscillospiraceae bacterium]|nr:TIGR04197 family type VII secretion effector [Oscillospiraceae bacterium]